MSERPFAVITGASTGIGYELALLAAAEGYDLLIVADEERIFDVAESLRNGTTRVDVIMADLSTIPGNDALLEAVKDRPVDALFANAGRGLGRGFLDQDFSEICGVIDTNITGTLYLVQQIGRRMRSARRGRILITGSIAGVIPGTYQAVYNGTEALLDSFSIALRAELKDSGVTVTCLMPGPTETQFFRRADLLDTKVGTSEKQPASEVARLGYDALMRGEAQVITGWKNKLVNVVAGITPSTLLAEQHRMQAEPGGSKPAPPLPPPPIPPPMRSRRPDGVRLDSNPVH